MANLAPYIVKVTGQASAASVSEGGIAKLTVLGDPGAVIPYFVVGVGPEDIVGQQVNGRVTLDDLGIGTISLSISDDNKTEGPAIDGLCSRRC